MKLIISNTILRCRFVITKQTHVNVETKTSNSTEMSRDSTRILHLTNCNETE